MSWYQQALVDHCIASHSRAVYYGKRVEGGMNRQPVVHTADPKQKGTVLTRSRFRNTCPIIPAEKEQNSNLWKGGREYRLEKTWIFKEGAETEFSSCFCSGHALLSYLLGGVQQESLCHQWMALAGYASSDPLACPCRGGEMTAFLTSGSRGRWWVRGSSYPLGRRAPQAIMSEFFFF